jgi:hypothetical protein
VIQFIKKEMDQA